MSRSALVRSADNFNDFRLPYEPEQIPLVIEMIRAGKDGDTIIRSLLGDDVQISIDAINEACSILACRR